MPDPAILRYMQWWQAIIMGIVEGVTEFLPVSSTGHMILVGKVMGVGDSEFVKSFEIVVQLGAIAAVATIYLKKLIGVRYWWSKLAVAFVPTAVVGAWLYPLIKGVFLASQGLVVVSLVVGGVMTIFFERMIKDQTNKNEVTKKQAWWVGVGQAISVVPGVSRSMATILTGRLVGMSRVAATEFSFLLAVPTMIAATGKDLLEVGWKLSRDEYGLIFLGMVVSFVTAWIVVKTFVKFVQTRSLEIFGWYRIAVGVVYYLVFLAQ